MHFSMGVSQLASSKNSEFILFCLLSVRLTSSIYFTKQDGERGGGREA
jgi:hypothetical protein